MMSESLETIGGNYVEILWPGGVGYFKSVLHETTGIVVVATWFTVLFRFLADARPSWKEAIAGGVLTSVLFNIGKLILQFLLVNSNISSLYGASGSVVLVLLFVFYSSFILYYGASFIFCYSEKAGLSIQPAGKAFAYKIEEVVPEGIDNSKSIADAVENQPKT
jgi:membrane protein